MTRVVFGSSHARAATSPATLFLVSIVLAAALALIHHTRGVRTARAAGGVGLLLATIAGPAIVGASLDSELFGFAMIRAFLTVAAFLGASVLLHQLREPTSSIAR